MAVEIESTAGCLTAAMRGCRSGVCEVESLKGVLLAARATGVQEA